EHGRGHGGDHEHGADGHDAARAALAAREVGTAQSDEPQHHGPGGERSADDVEARLRGLGLLGGQDEQRVDHEPRAYLTWRAATSSGSSTYSSVRPRTNSPGWMTNDSSSRTSTSSLRFCGGSARSMAAMRWLWKTRKELPSRRSTLAGWTMASSHGSMRTRPSPTRRRIVPAERTEVGGIRPKSASGRPPG